VGHVEEGAAAEQRAVEGRQLVPLRPDLAEEPGSDEVGMLDGGLAQRHEEHAFSPKLVVQFDLARMGAPLAEPAAGGLDGVGGRRAVRLLERRQTLQLEPFQVGPAPLLVDLRGQAQPLVDGERLTPPSAQPVGLPVEGGDLLHGFHREGHGYPTEPSISSWISRLSSTAYSSGSSLVKGSMKPLTIIVSASSSGMPRLMR